MTGVGGIIGITENRGMSVRWIVTGPESSRVVEEFTGEHVYDDDIELPHHEEGYASQYRFQCIVKDMMEVLLSSGNLCHHHKHVHQ